MEVQSENKFIKLINKDFSKLDAIELSADYLEQVSQLREYNELIAEYYKQMLEDKSVSMSDLYKRTAENVKNCHRLFISESYPLIRLKDITSVSLCRNRFCPNCQKLLQEKRVSKFKPFIDKALAEGLNLYHVVFTVKNPIAENLPLEYATMQKAFALLIRYLSGNAALANSPIPSWGFRSAFRAIEITYNEKDEFHPHYHCIFAFTSNPFDNKTIVNKFSYRQGHLDRYYSENEVLLQKLWRVLVDVSRCKISYSERMRGKLYPGIKLSKKRLAKIMNDIEYGFSVTTDKLTEQNMYEVFKYTAKFTSDEHRLMSYPQFKTLHYTLLNKRCVQCFGDWYGLGEELEELTADDMKEIHAELRQWWQSLDTAEVSVDSPKQLAIEISREGLRVVWRAKLRQNLDKIVTLVRRDGQISIDELFNVLSSEEK